MSKNPDSLYQKHLADCCFVVFMLPKLIDIVGVILKTAKIPPKPTLQKIAQFKEEPFVLAFLVSLFKFGVNNMVGLFLLHRIFEDFLVKSNVYTVTSGHQMVIVDNLVERLDLGLLLNLLLGHTFYHNPWVSINISDQSVAKGFIRSVFVIGFDNQ